MIRNIKVGILLALISMVMFSCGEDDSFTPISATIPSEVNIIIKNSQENEGELIITPTASGASYFEIWYGDDTVEPVKVDVGSSTMHSYTEGDYQIKCKAYNINGESVEVTRDVSVSFDPPMNLVVDVVIDLVNTNVVTVTPSAENAIYYDVWFGEIADEEPIQVMDGNSISYTYSENGVYTIKVVANSGSVNTLEYTEDVTIVVPAAQLSMPIDFENEEIEYSIVSFGNAELSVVANPDASGINTSGNVGSFLKPSGAETWAGGFLQLPIPIDFSELTSLSMDVWSPKSGVSILMKLENASDDQIFHEVTVSNTASDAWETLHFDFSTADLTQEYHKIVVFMDFGVAGDDAQYYFDNIALSNGGVVEEKIELPLTFESENIDYTFTSFGNAGSEVIDNPAMEGINTSAKVVKLNKASGAEVWAGSFIELTEDIDFSAGTTFTLKSWSPKAGIQILMKLENGDDSNLSYEFGVNNTVANEWEEVSIDFSGIDQSITYKRIVIFFDFGESGDDSDYYFDDINLQ